MSSDIVIDKIETQKKISRALRFLAEPADICTGMTKFELIFDTRATENADFFSRRFSESLYCALTGDCPMDNPQYELDLSELKNAEIKGYAYQFTGDADVQLFVSPAVLDGVSGIIMHRLEWYKTYRNDDPDYEMGFLKPVFMAFEEDSSAALGLHYLWSTMESFYERYSNSDNDDEQYTGLVSTCAGS